MAKTKKFELQTWVDTRVMPLVVPLLGDDGAWEPWKTAMLAALMKDTAYGKGKLMEVVKSNPVSAQLSLVKCAQLGLSPDPALEHFALVPRGGAIDGEVMWRGWQHLMLESTSAVAWIHADVIYKEEYAALGKAGIPLRDPITNAINAPQVVDEVKRDAWADKDIVASYCDVALRGKERHVAVVLTRKNLDMRRKLAQTDKVWAAHYALMCKAKAVKALARLGQVPLSVRTVQLLDSEPEDEAQAQVVAPIARPVVEAAAAPAGAMVADAPPPPPDRAQPASDFLFDELQKDPLPSEDDEKKKLLHAIEMAADAKKMDDTAVSSLIYMEIDDQNDDIEDLTVDQLQKLFTAIDEASE